PKLHYLSPEGSRQPCRQEPAPMRLMLLLSVALPLFGQEKTEPAPSPVPATESWLTGSVDLGYRWKTDVAGSFDAYRNIVNLGAGPKLIGTEFTLAKTRAFDRVDVYAFGWGGEPYSTFHLTARKAKLYDFRGDYRDLAYFNFLPSFAGSSLGQDIR